MKTPIAGFQLSSLHVPADTVSHKRALLLSVSSQFVDGVSCEARPG